MMPIKQYSLSQALLSQRDYWEHIVNLYQPLPCDKTNTEKILSKHEKHHVVRLDSEHTQQLLRDVPRVYHTEINDILLAALAYTITSMDRQQKA